MGKKQFTKHLQTKEFAFGSFKAVEGGKVSVTFDFSRAPIPRDTYSASCAFLKTGPNHDVFLVFAQVDAITGKVVHTLQIKFDDLSLLNMWINSKDFSGRVSEWYASAYGQPLAPVDARPVPEGTSFFQLSANLAFLGHQESSAVAAFYYFDPRAARDIAVGRTPSQELVGTPVVQVKLNTAALWSLLRELQSYVASLAERYPAVHERVTAKEQEKLGIENA